MSDACHPLANHCPLETLCSQKLPPSEIYDCGSPTRRSSAANLGFGAERVLELSPLRYMIIQFRCSTALSSQAKGVIFISKARVGKSHGQQSGGHVVVHLFILLACPHPFFESKFWPTLRVSAFEQVCEILPSIQR